MFISEQFAYEGGGGMGERRAARRPRIVRPQGMMGTLEAVYSSFYRVLLMLLPVR